MTTNRSKKSIRWIFNGQMIVGAIFGYWIVGSLQNLNETAHHTGTGVLVYENGELTVSEKKYKRGKYVDGGIKLFLGVTFWILAAKNAHRKDMENASLSGLNK